MNSLHLESNAWVQLERSFQASYSEGQAGCRCSFYAVLRWLGATYTGPFAEVRAPLSLTPDRDQVVLPDRALSVAYETLSELSRREIA